MAEVGEGALSDMESKISRESAGSNGRFLRFAFLAAGFAIVHGLYAAVGVRFRADSIDFFAQLLDPPLLEGHLLQSLWFLHAQPPLFNLLTGIALKIAPHAPSSVLFPLYLGAGFATTAMLADLLARCGAGAWRSAILALAFASTPAFLLYENWYFYPHLEQFLLVTVGWCLLRSEARAGAWFAASFASLGALVMLRSLFHPAYFVIALVVALAFLPRGERGRATKFAAAPLAIIFVWCVKNAVLFGFIGTSSWGGNSLHRMMTETLAPERVEAMITEGTLTPLSREWEFSPPEVYREILGANAGADRGIPALDTTGKSRTRENPVNYNHWIYPVASRVYAKGAFVMMRAEPLAYLASIRWTAGRFLEPVTDDAFLGPNRFPIRGLVRSWERFETSAFARCAAFAALAWAAFLLVRRRGPAHERLLIAFAFGTVLWIATLGIALEYGENNRFRESTVALLFILEVIAIRDAGRAIVQAWSRAARLGE